MYKVQIDISDWGSDETVTIETSDFEKVQIIQEFIEFQQEHGWAVDYEKVELDESVEEDEADEQTTDINVAVLLFSDDEKPEQE